MQQTKSETGTGFGAQNISPILSLIIFLGMAVTAPTITLADRPAAEEAASGYVDPGRFHALHFRHVGPYRGGRSTAVAGIPEQPFTFYLGTTGGGVFKTTDAGQSWANVSDGFFAAGSIGAVAVAESDPDVVYVGTGSACPRGNVSPGIGMYKSLDAGATWQHIGLKDAGQIGKLAIHPRNANLVYVAALGHIFGPNEQRGVFRSRDGGKNWERVLYVNDETGAVDIKMDPRNPNVIYAAFWRAERKPWTIISGGHDGGIYKTSDGGDHWRKLSDGLPKGLTGRIGIAVSPANPKRIWAIIEGERKVSGFARDESGMYRSDNAGRSWQHISSDPELHQRPWYYHHLVADPQDDSVVYHVGDKFWKSGDGGVSFETIEVPHVDQHDLWINPKNPKIMIEANDGGGTVSLNGGVTWSSQLNQPTAELYRLAVDEEFPYRVYSGQQDYSTISLPSRAFSAGGITLQHWTAVGGGEMGPVAVDQVDADIVYAGGFLSRMNRKTGQVRRIMDYPQYWSGVPAAKLKFRVPSDSPVRLSRHDPEVVYATSQFVHRSRNGGQSWELISPDLTRNDPDKIVVSGGPLTRDISSVETYCTIFVLAESPLTAGVLWAGSNDGLVHLTRNGGESWTDVTPDGMPEWGTVNSIDLSRHAPGRAVMAVTRYRLDDFHPYIFRTDDYGASWRLISSGNGIPDDHFVRVVREDPGMPGLLYAGSEFGLYVSFDDGGNWQPFQLDLPITPVTDLALHHDDLVVATQGRGFWILDDVTPLHQLGQLGDSPFLFKPRDAYRVEGGWRQPGPYMSQDDLLGGIIETHRVGENPPPGVMIFYYLPDSGGQARDVRVTILDGDGNEVRPFSSASDDAVSSSPGMNRLVWDLSYPGADVIPGSRLDGYIGGPRAVPGNYGVRLELDEWDQTQGVEVLPDPRSESTLADLSEQFDFLIELRDRITQTHDAVRSIRSIRDEIAEANARIAAEAETGKAAGERDIFLRRLAEVSNTMNTELDELEDRFRQKRSTVWQDTGNFEPLLDDQFAWVAAYTLSADTRPTDSAYERYDDLTKELAIQLARLDRVRRDDVSLLRKIVQDWENR